MELVPRELPTPIHPHDQYPPLMSTVLSILFVFVSVFMMLVILIQKPKGGGLSGAFGGAGSGSDRAFVGGNVGDVLTWITVICFGLFLILAMGLTWVIRAEEFGPDANPVAASAPNTTSSTTNTGTTATPTVTPTPEPTAEPTATPTLTPDSVTESPVAGPTAGGEAGRDAAGEPIPALDPTGPAGAGIEPRQ